MELFLYRSRILPVDILAGSLIIDTSEIFLMPAHAALHFGNLCLISHPLQAAHPIHQIQANILTSCIALTLQTEPANKRVLRLWLHSETAKIAHLLLRTWRPIEGAISTTEALNAQLFLKISVSHASKSIYTMLVPCSYAILLQ